MAVRRAPSHQARHPTHDAAADQHQPMTHCRPRWLIATLLVAGVGLLPTGCGADPTLQRQESSVLARTCASLREMSPLWEMVQEGVDLKSIEWSAAH